MYSVKEILNLLEVKNLMKMRINLGKTVALTLALVMLFGLMPMTVMATGTLETPEEFAVESELGLLSTTTPIGTVLVDYGGVRIIYQGFVRERQSFFLCVQIQNNSPYFIIVQTRNATINGHNVTGVFSEEITQGNISNARVNYGSTTLSRIGVDSVDQITHMAVDFLVLFGGHVPSTRHQARVVINGSQPPPSIPPAPPPPLPLPVTEIGAVLLDRDGVRITYQGFWRGAASASVQFNIRIENNTDELRNVRIRRESVNRIMIDGILNQTVPARSVRDAGIQFTDATLLRNGITNVDQIAQTHFEFRVSDSPFLSGNLFTVPDVIITIPQQNSVDLMPGEDTPNGPQLGWLPPLPVPELFPDSQNHWAAGVRNPDDTNYIGWAMANGITAGFPDETFRPNGRVTRAEFTAFLYRIAEGGTPPVRPELGFADMRQAQWHHDYVAWAYSEDIVTGFSSNNTFRPNNPITREQLVLMLFRYMGEESVATDVLSEFSDSNRITSWARDAMNWAAYHGLIGRGGTLNPGGNATRAETLAILHRVVETFEIPAPQTP